MPNYQSFYQIDTPEAQQLLKTVKSKLEPYIDGILDRFGAYIATEPELQEIVGDRDLAPVLNSLKNHWLSSLENGVDDTHAQRVERIGTAHERIGLNPAYFIGGMSYVEREFLGLKTTKKSLFKTEHVALLNHEELKVLMSFLKYDMAMAILVYQQKSNKMAGVLSTSTDFIDQIASDIEQTASSVTEMSSTVHEISEQATKAQSHASDVSGKMESVNSGMKELQEASDKIGGVLKIILEISERTNLLSLNAAIEAARAGEHGKGFAVVADEVKKLASRTNSSVEEINQQIASIQKRITLSTEDVGNVTDAIKQIEEINTSISASVHEQSSVTDQMQNFVQDVLENTGKTKEKIEAETSSLLG